MSTTFRPLVRSVQRRTAAFRSLTTTKRWQPLGFGTMFQSPPQRRTIVVTKTSAAASDMHIDEFQADEASRGGGPATPDSSSPASRNTEHSISISPSCSQQIQTLASKRSLTLDELYLRVFVDAGGCSGFQYQFELVEDSDEPVEEDDFIFSNEDKARVVVDEASLNLIHGSTIDFVQEMIKSAFVVSSNPQSESACGCGSSFAVKNFDANPALD